MGKGTVNRQILKCKADTLSEPEAAEVLEYIGIMELLRDEQCESLTETIAKLLGEPKIGAPESTRNQIRRQSARN